AEALLGAELADGPTAARTALARALAEPHGADVVRVRLHPADHELVVSATDADLAVPAGIELVADASLARGEAVGELEAGYLDARLGTAVERARTALGVDR
ncbi:FliH/SctL family protein, partial [Georgenia subflava]